LDFFVGRCQESIFGNRFVVSDKIRKTNSTEVGAGLEFKTVIVLSDTNKDGALDNGEPSDTATKTWRSAPATKITLAPKGDVNIRSEERRVGKEGRNRSGPDEYKKNMLKVTGDKQHSEAVHTDTNGQ